MKKFLNLAVIFAAMTSLLTFSACGEEEDDPKGPSIELKSVNGVAVVNDSADFAEGENNVTVQITAGDAKLDSWDVTVDGISIFGADKKAKELDKSQTIQNKDFSFTAHNGTKVVITVTDKDGLTDAKTIEIEAKKAPVEYTQASVTLSEGMKVGFKQGETTGEFEVISFTENEVVISINGENKTLGNSKSTEGSYMTTDFNVLLTSEAKNAASTILFIYKDGKIMSSPKGANASEIVEGSQDTKFAIL